METQGSPDIQRKPPIWKKNVNSSVENKTKHRTMQRDTENFKEAIINIHGEIRKYIASVE